MKVRERGRVHEVKGKGERENCRVRRKGRKARVRGG